MTTLASSLQEVQITTLLQAFKARTENSASVAGGICARTVLSAMYSINPLILSDRSVRAGIFSDCKPEWQHTRKIWLKLRMALKNC